MKPFDSFRRTALLLLFACGLWHTVRAAGWEPTKNAVVWKGDIRRLVLLVETPDRPFYTPDAREEYDRMLNGENYTGLGCAGSARQFLMDNSGGAFRPQFQVVGPLRLSHSMGYYGGKPAAGEGSDGDVGKMVVEACRMADAEGVDFSYLDYNGDGRVDNVYLFYSGPLDTSVPTPWPHASGVAGGGLVLDGKLVDSYAISQEMATETRRGGYTTFLHEFGHTLGLPDDYSGRLGHFSIYCDGTFDEGIVPVNFNAAERLILGWLDYREIDADGEYVLEPLARNKALLLKTNNPDEYFLFSNRSNGGEITPWDARFAYGGLLVWHIDRSQNPVTWSDDNGTHSSTALGMWQNNSPNASASHPCHELVEADNIDAPGDYRPGMYFPGSRKVTEISSATHPEFRAWSGASLGVEIYDIRQRENGDIVFSVRRSANGSVSIAVRNGAGKLQTNAYVGLAPVAEVARPASVFTRSLEPVAGGRTFAGDTGLTGVCTFEEVPAGKYRLTVDKEEYLVYHTYIDVLPGDNSAEAVLQSYEEAVSGTELKWYSTDNLRTVFFVPNQIRAAGWDAADLAPYAGQQLRKAKIWLDGGRKEVDLMVFVDDRLVCRKTVENVVPSGITTVDLDAERITVEAGRSLKVGYLITAFDNNGWPSTADSGPVLDGKGGLTSMDGGSTWGLNNDLGANWGISILLTDNSVTPVERISFENPAVEMAVGEETNLRVEVYPAEVIDRKVTWQSSDEKVLTVSEHGRLRAVAVGRATVTATSVQNPEATAACEVRVQMSGSLVGVTPYQREARIEWPGFNPDTRWQVSWRRRGDAEYVAAPPQAETTLWIEALAPGTRYEARIERTDGESARPVTFAFDTRELTSRYAVIDLAQKRHAVGDTIPLIVSNIDSDTYRIVWKLDGEVLEGRELILTEPGTHELRAEVAWADGTREVLVKELEIHR